MDSRESAIQIYYEIEKEHNFFEHGPKCARGDSTEQTGFPSCKYHNTKDKRD